MDDFISVIVAILITFLVLASLVLGVTYGLSRPSCYAHWAHSGMKAQWSFFGDCQLQQPDGSWITDDAYLALTRNVDMKQPSTTGKE